MKICIDLSEEMKDYILWKDNIINDLMMKHFSYYHEDTRLIKSIFMSTVNNYENGLEFVNKLFYEVLEHAYHNIEHENVLIGIMYCIKYIDYDKIKNIAIPMFNRCLTIDNADLQEILIMMYHDDESLWNYKEGIQLLESIKPFKRKYLNNYFEEIKNKYNN